MRRPYGVLLPATVACANTPAMRSWPPLHFLTAKRVGRAQPTKCRIAVGRGGRSALSNFSCKVFERGPEGTSWMFTWLLLAPSGSSKARAPHTSAKLRHNKVIRAIAKSRTTSDESREHERGNADNKPNANSPARRPMRSHLQGGWPPPDIPKPSSVLTTTMQTIEVGIAEPVWPNSARQAKHAQNRLGAGRRPWALETPKSCRNPTSSGYTMGFGKPQACATARNTARPHGFGDATGSHPPLLIAPFCPAASRSLR